MFTTKSKGQGFGLAVIKRMTEALGGTVSFESQEGKGTTFTVRLPPPRVKTVNGLTRVCVYQQNIAKLRNTIESRYFNTKLDN